MAHHIQQMIRTHPSAASTSNQEALRACIEACFECAQTCTSCADACLAEPDVQMLTRCIRLNLDCADVCETTGRLLLRQTEPDWSLLNRQLQACAEACRVCGAECEKHASQHEHCQICAESCRMCEEACNRVLAA